MADWTTITETATDPDAPVTSSLIKALRDNPSAIAEGASGATRIRVGALQRLAAGANIRLGVSGTFTPETCGFSLVQKGTIRVSVDLRDSWSVTVTRSRGVTDTVVLTGSVTSGTFATVSGDFSVNPGDNITITFSGSSPGQDASNLYVMTSGADIFPVGLINIADLGNTYNA